MGINTDPEAVGARCIRLLFLDDGVEQSVPLDWVLPPAMGNTPLADNWMHRAPVPTVHMIRRRDLCLIRETKGSYDAVVNLQVDNSARCAALGAQHLEEIIRPRVGSIDRICEQAAKSRSMT